MDPFFLLCSFATYNCTSSRFVGSPGIGKTVLGLYILMQLKVCIYLDLLCVMKRESTFKFDESLRGQANKGTVVYEAKGVPVRKFGWGDNGEPHVYESRQNGDVSPFKKDLHNLDVWYVHEP